MKIWVSENPQFLNVQYFCDNNTKRARGTYCISFHPEAAGSEQVGKFPS